VNKNGFDNRSQIILKTYPKRRAPDPLAPASTKRIKNNRNEQPIELGRD